MPSSTSSRLTPFANALSFIFFLTDFASTSCTLFVGFTSAVAVISPVSSSTAKSARAMRVSRGTPEYTAWPRIACRMSSGQPRCRRKLTPQAGCSSVAECDRVRVALVVEVVDETGEAPTFRIFAEMLGVRTHGGFDGQHVLPERIARRELFHQRERCGPGGEAGVGREGILGIYGSASGDGTGTAELQTADTVTD